MLPSAGVKLGPVSASAGLDDESAAPPAAATFRSVAFTLAPSAFCSAVWMRLVRVALVGDRFAPVRLYEACGDSLSQDTRSQILQSICDASAGLHLDRIPICNMLRKAACIL